MRNICRRFVVMVVAFGFCRSLHDYIVESNLPPSDSYTLLTYRNDTAGTLGASWIRSTCNKLDNGYKANINEYFHDEILTAQVSLTIF